MRAAKEPAVRPERPARALPRLPAGLVEPHPALREPERRRRARLLSAMLLVVAPFSLVSSVASTALTAPGSDPFTNPLAALGMVGLALGAGLYLLSRGPRHEVAAALTVAGTLGGTWASVLLAPGTPHEASAPYFLGLSVILSSVFLPARVTAGLAAANLAAVFALPRLVPGLGSLDVLNVGLFLFFVSAFITVFAAVRRDDLRQIEDQARRLAEREAELRAIVDHAPVTIATVDRGGTLRYLNRAFPGLPVDEALGTRLLDHVSPEERPRLADILAQVFATGRPVSYEVRCAGPAGAPAWRSSSVGPIEHDGRVVAATLITQDVTALKEAAEERSRSEARAAEIERLKEVARFKTNFINTAAHELRTPMTPIKTHVFLLKRAGLGTEERRSLEVIERNLLRMGELLQDVLDVARLQAGRLAVRQGPLDLAPMLRDAVDGHRAVARARGLALEDELPDGLPVHGDAERLAHVVSNLLATAMRFTPEGGRVRLAAGLEGPEVVVRVRDGGPGLSPAELENLFQPFAQIHHLPDATSRGTGLGLYLSQQIVERHGGRLDCASAPGRGTTFTLALPLAAPLATP